MASRFTFRDRAGLLFSLSIDIVNVYVCLIVFRFSILELLLHKSAKSL